MILNITHVSDVVDPVRDIEIINTELLLADINTVENKVTETENQIQRWDGCTVKKTNRANSKFVGSYGQRLLGYKIWQG